MKSEPNHRTNGENLPELYVPGARFRVSDSARQAGELLDKTERFFHRDGKLFELKSSNGDLDLKHVTPARFVSAIEEVATVMDGRKSECHPRPTILTKDAASLILESSEFGKAIPEIKCVTRSPVLIERDKHLIEVVNFDRQSGILAGGTHVPRVALKEAKSLLNDLLHDFKFMSVADRSRALAALLSPALTFGGLLGGNRTPATIIEANESQTGKGFLVPLIGAVYREKPSAITQKKHGVGGLEETFDTQVVKGTSFIYFDNIRGKFDSPKLETFLTEDTYSARVPYSTSIQIDPRRTIILFTSNRAELTEDLAKRGNLIRLLHQPKDYRFMKYSDGDLLEHVKANQATFLAAVFAIIREWYCQGKRASENVDHDFRGWANILNSIVVDILNEAPLMDGHRQAQRRTSVPELNWLRDVAHAVGTAGRYDDFLQTSDLLDIIQRNPAIEIPGSTKQDIEDSTGRENACRAIGRRMKRCFGDATTRDVDGVRVELRTAKASQDKYRERKEYRFSRIT